MVTLTYDFDGSIVLVTGANGNLGSAVARAFVESNARLVLLGRSHARVLAAVPDLIDTERVAVAPSTDLTDEAAVAAAIAWTIARFGRIDVLANTVGGYRGGASVADASLADWDAMLALNLRTALLMSKAVIPQMVTRGSGRIIHTASRAAVGGARNAAAYAAAKAGVLSLTQSLAAEVKRSGINVNCVLPGTIDTPQNRQAMPSANHTRWVSAASVAGVFLFLASDAAADLHGVHLPVYGLS